ncbi:MAG: hypothetical protein ACK4V2_03355 [Pseudomonadota bacterium]|jgi:hypothetical protein|nr:hypothetical protein [Alphaproteobacteria bacterium]
MLIFLVIIAFCQVIFAVSGFDAADFHHCYNNGANFEVIAENVGQGGNTLLKNKKNGSYVVVDFGTSSDTPNEIINRIACALGIGEVHADLPDYAGKITVIISHSDKDHLNLLTSPC